MKRIHTPPPLIVNELQQSPKNPLTDLMSADITPIRREGLELNAEATDNRGGGEDQGEGETFKT